MTQLPIALLLHPAAQIGWTQFTVHASTVVGLLLLGALYTWRARRGAPRTTGGRASPTPGQRALLCIGLLTIFFSLNGPLHDLSDFYLFSAHMVQHLLLTLVVPPLLIRATPGWMLRPALANRVVGPVARWITRPVVCFAIWNLVLAFWHLPPVYAQAMGNHEVHIAQHLMFMVAATLMWWPILSPLPELPRLSYPGQMLYCFLLTLPMSIVSVYITYAEELLYPAYGSAPRIMGISPMQDQLIGGLIMWIPGGLFFYGILSVVFFKWVARGAVDTRAGAQVAG